MDPNSSVLLMFDPIAAHDPKHTPNTPARVPINTHTKDELTMSTFFNRIGTAPAQPPVHDNRRSLIDLDNSIRETRDTNRPVAPSLSSEMTPTPKLLPHNIFLPPSPGHESKALPEIRVSSKDQPPTRPKTKPDKVATLSVPSSARAPRRSSLDLSALTWNLQDRLADMSFGFDLINDEMSMLSEVSDVDASVPAFKTRRMPSSVPATQPAFILPPLDFDPPLTSRPVQPRKVSPPIPSPPRRSIALPAFEFETKTEDLLPELPKSTRAAPSQRKGRKSVFDALENTPTASAAQTPPNIVTSWSSAAPSRKSEFKIPTPPEFKVPAAPSAVSRHRRTHSSSSTSSQSGPASRSSFMAPSSSRTMGKTTLPSVAGSPEAVRTAPSAVSTTRPSSLEREKEKMRAAREREREREHEREVKAPVVVPTAAAVPIASAVPSLRRTRTSIMPSSSEPRSLASTTTRTSLHTRSSSITRPESRSSTIAPSTVAPSRTLSRTTSVQSIARPTSIVRSQSRIGVLPTQPAQTLRSKPSTYALRETVNEPPQSQQPAKTLRPRASTYSIRSSATTTGSVSKPESSMPHPKPSVTPGVRPLVRTRSRGSVRGV